MTSPSVEVASHLGLDRLILKGAQTASRESHTTMGVSNSKCEINKGFRSLHIQTSTLDNSGDWGRAHESDLDALPSGVCSRRCQELSLRSYVSD